MKPKEILGEVGMHQALDNLTNQIAISGYKPKDTHLVGVITRGVFLAKRIAKKIKKEHGLDYKVGILDSRPFRDDLKMDVEGDRTQLGFAIKDKNIILVDDVISTGRTVRASLDALIHYGRPKRILTASLIDLDHREFPILSDFVGVKLHTSITEKIKVKLKEADGGRDCAVIIDM